MEQKPEFKYYYGNEAEQYSFFKIPKLLITHEYFKILSNDAKILYGLLLDRMSLSVKNKWFDEENRAYIVCSIEEIAELLNCSRNKAIKSLQELDTEKGIGLIEKRRLGQGKNTVMYVKNFLIRQEVFPGESNIQEAMPQKSYYSEFKSQQSNAEEVSEVQNLNFQKSKIWTSRSPKNQLQEVQNVDYSNNDFSNTEYINTSNPISSLLEDGKEKKRYDVKSERTVQAYQELIKENIEYDTLLQVYRTEQKTIEGIYQLIVETVVVDSEKILIASNWYPAQLVKSKFLKLNYKHIEYVLNTLQRNTTKIRNIKKYILASLFNAPSTLESYYQAEVNHDFPQYAQGK